MGPKKKLSKKEKARIEAEQAEILRIEMEKEKQRKQEEERKRKQKELEEAEKRQKLEIVENEARRKQLKESVAYFQSIKNEINNYYLEMKKQKQWEHYMKCNGLPNAKNPGDLRKYIFMLSNSLCEIKAKERNWLLKTNERTILTQNKDIPNLTRDNLRKQQENLGDAYAKRVREILGILSEIDEAIKDGNIIITLMKELQNMKTDFRLLLVEFIDDFTHRILSHVNRDMQSDNTGLYEYIYTSDVFKMQILCMQGKSQTDTKPRLKDSKQHTEVKFPLLELQILLPVSVCVENSALRALWLNYDHFSDYCPSYSGANINRNHLNILQQTKKEWKKRKEILQSALDEATKETPSASFDLPDRTQSDVIDVDKIYTEYEDNLNRSYRQKIGIEGLNLSEFDVNLRSHRIIAGVYCINYLDQPQQDKRLNSESFIRTIMAPNKLTSKYFYQSYRPPPPPQPGVRRLPEEIEAEMKLVESGLDKLALVSLQLPDTVLWLEPPIVCRFETVDDLKESITTIEPEDHISEDSTRKSEKIHSKQIRDFDLYNIPNHIEIHELMMEFVVPRLPFNYTLCLEYEDQHQQTTSIHLIEEKKEKSLTNSEEVSIKRVLAKTSEPRAFHQIINSNKALKIKEISKIVENNLITEDNITKLNDLESNIENTVQDASSPTYMFSKLIQDLDELEEFDVHLQDKQLKEISSSLVLPRSSLSSRRLSSVIFVREDDIKSEESICDNETEASGSEYEDDVEGEEETLHKTNDGELMPECGKWSTKNVHDAKFNEDKLSIQFRTGRLGYFGFAVNKYSNIPYQTWELKPDFKNPGTVLFSLTAAVISIEIHISADGFRVNAFQGGTTQALNDMIGKLLSLDELREILTTSSVDIFPEEDAFCYSEGTCEKNYVMEMHLYNCMALIALSYNFSWSRWNLLSGSRAAVLLMREMIENRKIPNHSTLLVTPLKATIIECVEVSASFNPEGVAGMEFYADLYHLALAQLQPESKKKQNTMSATLRNNIAMILMAIRPLSFC